MDIGKLSTKIITPTVIPSLKWRAITVLPSEVGAPVSTHFWQPWWMLCPFCLTIEWSTLAVFWTSQISISACPLSSAFLFLLLLAARITWLFLYCYSLAINFSRSLRGTLTDFDPSHRIIASLLNPLPQKVFSSQWIFSYIFLDAHPLHPASSISNTWDISKVDWIYLGWVFNTYLFCISNCLIFFWSTMFIFLLQERRTLLVSYKIHPLTLKFRLYLPLMTLSFSLFLWRVSAITSHLLSFTLFKYLNPCICKHTSHNC